MVECSFQKIDLFNIEPTNKNSINDTLTFNYNLGYKQFENIQEVSKD